MLGKYDFNNKYVEYINGPKRFEYKINDPDCIQRRRVQKHQIMINWAVEMNSEPWEERNVDISEEDVMIKQLDDDWVCL